MKNATLRNVRVVKVDFNNSLPNGSKIELGFRYKYNVRYSARSTCEGEFIAEIENKSDKKSFHIYVTMIGFFTVKPDSPKEVLHVETYNELFPYLRAFVSSLTATAGFPPVTAQFVDISGSNIYRFNMDEMNRQADRFREDGDDEDTE